MEAQHPANSTHKPLHSLPVNASHGVNGNSEVDLGSMHTAVPEQGLNAASSNQTMTDNSENLSKTTGKTTVKEIGKIFKSGGTLALRALAGVGGGAIVGGTALGGMALIGAIALPAFIITVPPALLGAIIGGAIGAQDDSRVSTALREDFGKRGAGAILGALGGAALPVAAYLLTESAASLPKTAFVATVGLLGTGLLAFAITGKRERDENVSKDMDTTNEKLQKALILSTVPVWRVLKIGEKHKKHVKDFIPN